MRSLFSLLLEINRMSASMQSVESVLAIFNRNVCTLQSVSVHEDRVLELLTNSGVCIEQISTAINNMKIPSAAYVQILSSVQAMFNNVCRWISHFCYNRPDNKNEGIGNVNEKHQGKCENCEQIMQTIKIKTLKEQIMGRQGILSSLEKGQEDQESDDENFLSNNFWAKVSMADYERNKHTLYPKADSYLTHLLTQEKLRTNKYQQIDSIMLESKEKGDVFEIGNFEKKIDETINQLLNLVRNKIGRNSIVKRMMHLSATLNKMADKEKQAQAENKANEQEVKKEVIKKGEEKMEKQKQKAQVNAKIKTRLKKYSKSNIYELRGDEGGTLIAFGVSKIPDEKDKKVLKYANLEGEDFSVIQSIQSEKDENDSEKSSLSEQEERQKGSFHKTVLVDRFPLKFKRKNKNPVISNSGKKSESGAKREMKQMRDMKQIKEREMKQFGIQCQLLTSFCQREEVDELPAVELITKHSRRGSKNKKKKKITKQLKNDEVSPSSEFSKQTSLNVDPQIKASGTKKFININDQNKIQKSNEKLNQFNNEAKGSRESLFKRRRDTKNNETYHASNIVGNQKSQMEMNNRYSQYRIKSSEKRSGAASLKKQGKISLKNRAIKTETSCFGDLSQNKTALQPLYSNKDFGNEVKKIMELKNNKKQAEPLPQTRLPQKIFNIADLELFGGISEGYKVEKLCNVVCTAGEFNEAVTEEYFKISSHIKNVSLFKSSLYQCLLSFLMHPYQTVSQKCIVPITLSPAVGNKIENTIKLILNYHLKHCGSLQCPHLESFKNKIAYQ